MQESLKYSVAQTRASDVRLSRRQDHPSSRHFNTLDSEFRRLEDANSRHLEQLSHLKEEREAHLLELNQLRPLRNQLDSTRSALRAKQGQLKEISYQREELSISAAQLQQALRQKTQLAQRLKVSQDCLRAELREALQQKQQMGERVIRLSSENSSLASQLQSAARRCSQLQVQLRKTKESLQGRNCSVEQEYQTTKKEAEVYQSRAKELSRLLADKDSQLSKLRDQFQRASLAQRNLASANIQRKNVLRTLEQKCLRVQSLKRELDLAQFDRNRLNGLLQTAEKQLASLRRHSEQLRIRCERAQGENRQLRQYVQFLSDQIEREQQRITQLETFRVQTIYEVGKLRTSAKNCQCIS